MSPGQVAMGVLGCAKIADRSMIPAMRRSSEIRLVAVASRDPDRGKAFAARHETRACTYDELLDRDDIDAIYVPLPVGLHHEWGHRALRAGKHVLIEKTFTERYWQAIDLLRVAEEQGLIAMEALMYRFHPVHTQLRRLVRDGAIGELRHVDAQFGMPLLPRNDIRRQRQIGGGASLDSLVYPLSLGLELLEEPAVAAEATFVVDDGGLDVRGAVQMRWPSAVGQFAFGMGFFYRNRCTAWGTDGLLSLERAFTRTPEMAAELVLMTSAGQRRLTVPPANHFELLLAHFVSRVLGDATKSPAEAGDLLERMNWIERIRTQGGALDNGDA